MKWELSSNIICIINEIRKICIDMNNFNTTISIVLHQHYTSINYYYTASIYTIEFSNNHVLLIPDAVETSQSSCYWDYIFSNLKNIRIVVIKCKKMDEQRYGDGMVKFLFKTSITWHFKNLLYFEVI